jgi:mannose-6-phosphate isomerase-like protein (cupin superfamily)
VKPRAGYGPFHVSETYVALDAGLHARPLEVTADFWQALAEDRLGDVSRLVSHADFDHDWATWEKHPAGEEVVLLLRGAVEIVLEGPDGRVSCVLDRPGAFVVVPPDTWHTARVLRPAGLLFVTPGAGTTHRPV